SAGGVAVAAQGDERVRVRHRVHGARCGHVAVDAHASGDRTHGDERRVLKAPEVICPTQDECWRLVRRRLEVDRVALERVDLAVAERTPTIRYREAELTVREGSVTVSVASVADNSCAAVGACEGDGIRIR